MNKSPEISVIMPVYNGEKYLKEAIESILSQTYKNFEFLIVYDVSSDSTLSIIQKFQEKDERIILINGEGKKLIHALNKGIKESKGKYIARMDSDDISLPKRFERQMNHMERFKLDICGSHCLYFDKYNNINNVILSPLSHEMCVLSLVSKVPFSHSSVMIRSNFLKSNNLLYGQTDYIMAEDLDLWVRIHDKGGKFGNVNQVLFKYRVVDNSLSVTNRIGVIEDTKNILNKFFEGNKSDLLRILNYKHGDLNNAEESLKVRFAFKVFLKTFNFSIFKCLKGFNKKNIVYSILSEIKNYLISYTQVQRLLRIKGM
jgi:glycosyltransferase involved in cell wall biosynthesis